MVDLSILHLSILGLYARRNARMQNIAIFTLTMTTDIAFVDDDDATAVWKEISIAGIVAFIIHLLLGCVA